jgi:hypothetical protein
MAGDTPSIAAPADEIGHGGCRTLPLPLGQSDGNQRVHASSGTGSRRSPSAMSQRASSHDCESSCSKASRMRSARSSGAGGSGALRSARRRWRGCWPRWAHARACTSERFGLLGHHGLSPWPATCPCGCVRLAGAAKRYASRGRDRRASGGAHGPNSAPMGAAPNGAPLCATTSRLRHARA